MSKLDDQFELITTAYHEAGHVISGLLNFMIIPLASIRPDKEDINLGLTYYESLLDFNKVQDKRLFDNYYYSEIDVNYGGLAAEQILYKELCGTEIIPKYIKHGSHLDRKRVSEIVKLNNFAPPGKPRLLLKKKLYLACLKRLQRYWGDVKLVAYLLIKKKRIYHYHLVNLLKKKSKNKEFWRKQFKSIDFLYKFAPVLADKEIRLILKA